jgi:hypothetical protein
MVILKYVFRISLLLVVLGFIRYLNNEVEKLRSIEVEDKAVGDKNDSS